MGYYDEAKNVNDYIKMAEGFDGQEFYDILIDYLDSESTVLELGMGPGKDVDIFSQRYKVTGSDYSQVFLDYYLEKNPEADLILLDAITMNTDRKFDCIYSNKVLYHLSREEMKNSLEHQYESLNNGGLIFHTLWYGDQEEEEFEGLNSVYYTESDLENMLQFRFEIIEMKRYKEFEDGDSIYFIAKVKK